MIQAKLFGLNESHPAFAKRKCSRSSWMLKYHLPWEVFSIPQLPVLSSAFSWYVAYTFHSSILFFPVKVFHVAVSTIRLKDIQESRNYLVNLSIIHKLSETVFLLAGL